MRWCILFPLKGCFLCLYLQSKKKRYIAAALGVLLLGAAAVLALACHASGGQSTDDAYVSADFTLVSPRVAGQISTLAVEDNQPCAKANCWRALMTATMSMP